MIKVTPGESKVPLRPSSVTHNLWYQRGPDRLKCETSSCVKRCRSPPFRSSHFKLSPDLLRSSRCTMKASSGDVSFMWSPPPTRSSPRSLVPTGLQLQTLKKNLSGVSPSISPFFSISKPARIQGLCPWLPLSTARHTRTCTSSQL